MSTKVASVSPSLTILIHVSLLPAPTRCTARDFFLIMALCFVLACLLIVLLRPLAFEILWYIDAY